MSAVTKEEIFEVVKKVIKECMYEEIGTALEMDTHLVKDLGAESMDLATIVSDLEEQFEQEIDYEDVIDLLTIQKIVDFVYEAALAKSGEKG